MIKKSHRIKQIKDLKREKKANDPRNQSKRSPISLERNRRINEPEYKH